MSRGFDIDSFKLTDDQVRVSNVTPRKIQKRRQQFALLPMAWYERMQGAHGQTYRVAWYLLYLHWKGKGDVIKLANGMMTIDGVPRTSKWRALCDLERRGLIAIERRHRKSPLIKLLE